jgi:hypothetical protein
VSCRQREEKEEGKMGGGTGGSRNGELGEGAWVLREMTHVLDQLGGGFDVGGVIRVVIVIVLELLGNQRCRLRHQAAKCIAQPSVALELREPIHPSLCLGLFLLFFLQVSSSFSFFGVTEVRLWATCK